MKRGWKKWAALALVLVLGLLLAACSGNNAYGDQPPQSQETQQEDALIDLPQANQEEKLIVLPEAEPDQSLPEGNGPEEPGGNESNESSLDEDGWYNSKDEVALYIHLYGCLPGNYVTKREAQEAGWSGGNVEQYTGAGTAMGGSRFGNYEGNLPEAKGRTYTECDIETVGGSSRGAKRIVFSNDGLVYYTEDHYESFELLYGEP